MNDIYDVIKYFPNNIYEILRKTILENIALEKDIQEIRVRVNRPILLKLRNRDIIINYFISSNEILKIVEKLCDNSIYAYKNQICNGFITVRGGHRIGITGTAVVEDNKVLNLKYIASLNFRIAREVKGCSNKILDEVLDVENDTIFNTLIVSPPGQGKTTMLRDLIRNISNGVDKLHFKGKTCRCNR